MLLISVIALVSLLCALIILVWHIATAECPKPRKTPQRPRGGGRAERLRRRQARVAAEPVENSEARVNDANEIAIAQANVRKFLEHSFALLGRHIRVLSRRFASHTAG